MENLFLLSDDQLRILLDGYSAWCEKNEGERNYADDQEQRSKELRQTLLNKEYLSKVSDAEWAKKIFEYSRTLEGPVYIPLGEPRISGEKGKVKENLLYFIDSPDDPFKKAAAVLDGNRKIPYFSKAFWTPIFQAQYPSTLPNWNNKTDRFFKKVGINLTSSKLSVEEKYKLLSDAFLYLQKLDHKQNFHNINHLVHYGTVMEDGNKLIKKLLKGKKGNDADVKDLAQKIAKLQEGHVSDKRISLRKDAEAKAKKLLKAKIGNFGEVDLREFFRLMNHDFWDGKIRYNRFSMAYAGSNVNALVDQLPDVNSWFVKFWEATGNELEKLLDEFYKLIPIKNAGTAFPSVVLYLRDPSRFNLCFKRMEEGLFRLTGFLEKGYSGDFYLRFNDKVNELKNKYNLLPQEMDIILTVFNGTIDGKNPIYTLADCADETGIKEDILKSWGRGLERKRQAILYGPPGTGKTFVAERLARHLIGGGDGFTELVQFHPAYAYEDFIQGIRPKARADGGLDYPLVPGRFLQFCEKAKTCNDLCVLIIDEINRTNLARIFGELMYLLEYRDQEVPLASGGVLRIPHNVRIVGTMNTADRSIALVDHALRRRFAFLALYPDYEILRTFHKKHETKFNVEGLISVLTKLNKQIADRNYEIGPSFFLRQDLKEQIGGIWQMEIEPYLEEYFFDQPDKVDEFRWEKVGKDILS